MDTHENAHFSIYFGDIEFVLGNEMEITKIASNGSQIEGK